MKTTVMILLSYDILQFGQVEQDCHISTKSHHNKRWSILPHSAHWSNTLLHWWCSSFSYFINLGIKKVVVAVVKTMTWVHRVVWRGSTGSWTRSSDDMVSHCRREGGRGGGVLEQSHQQVSAAPAQSFLIGPIIQRAGGGSGCCSWVADVMRPWDTDGRRGQRGKWRTGRQQSTRWRRRRGPGRARG